MSDSPSGKLRVDGGGHKHLPRSIRSLEELVADHEKLQVARRRIAQLEQENFDLKQGYSLEVIQLKEEKRELLNKLHEMAAQNANMESYIKEVQEKIRQARGKT